MRLKFNEVSKIDTQTGETIQVEVTRMYLTNDKGAREIDAEIILSLYDCEDEMVVALSADQAKELIKRLQSLYEGVKVYNEILHDAQSIREK